MDVFGHLTDQSLFKPAVDDPSFFLVVTQTKIVRVNYATKESKALLSGFKGNLAIDVDVHNRHIYWSDRASKAIFRANVDGTSAITVINQNIGVCGGLAVEWYSRLLYWTDATYDTIQIASLNGKNRRTLFRDDLSDPWDLAVDPRAG